jgi:hypothetical protein
LRVVAAAVGPRGGGGADHALELRDARLVPRVGFAEQRGLRAVVLDGVAQDVVLADRARLRLGEARVLELQAPDDRRRGLERARAAAASSLGPVFFAARWSARASRRGRRLVAVAVAAPEPEP